MIYTLPTLGDGITDACFPPNVIDRDSRPQCSGPSIDGTSATPDAEFQGSEENSMGKKRSGRSLSDDAFGAAEAMSSRSRVMGKEFAKSVDEQARVNPDDPHRDREDMPSDPTEDPVRMYLTQMGQIPLLTRAQEVAAAKQIERTREKYRNCMLATDFMLQGSLKLLQQVRDKQLRLDRTIEVSVTNAVEKVAIMKRIVPNIRTIEHLLKLNKVDYLNAINRRLPMRQRRAAWKNLVIRRNKGRSIGRRNELANGQARADLRKTASCVRPACKRFVTSSQAKKNSTRQEWRPKKNSKTNFAT